MLNSNTAAQGSARRQNVHNGLHPMDRAAGLRATERLLTSVITQLAREGVDLLQTQSLCSAEPHGSRGL